MFAARAGRLLFVLGLCLAPLAAAAGQSSEAASRHHFAIRLGGDLSGTLHRVDVMVGVRAGSYRLGRIGPEAGLSLFPRYLSEFTALVPEAGVAYPRRLGGGVALVRAGLAPFLAFADGETGASFGAYAGAGLIVPLGSLGLRIDAGPRLLGGSQVAWSVGLGLSSVPRPWRLNRVNP